MKRIKNILMLSLLAVAFATSSCNDFLDVNQDPNRVTDENVTPDLIFTNAEVSIGQRQATRFVFLNNWMGYWSRSGTFVVEQEETTYKVTSTSTSSENNWDQAYNILFDLYKVKTKALASGDKVLAGASMVLSAKLWQETVDQFGAIPYKKAFDYVVNPRPTYDKAADIYTDLLIKLDSAIYYLNTTPKSSFAKTDVIFARGGDIATAVENWKKLANTIKLRMFLRQADKGFTPTASQLAKITTDGGLLGVDQNVAVNPGYVNSTDKQNPFYGAYGLTTSGAAATTNNKPNNYIVKTILGTTDPRLSRFFASPVTGTDYGAIGGNKISGGAVIVGTEIGPGLAGSATQDQWILPAFESLFFQAEASARGWAISSLTTDSLYKIAVRQSFKWLGTGATITKTLRTKDGVADSLATVYLNSVPKANWANAGTTASEKIKFIAIQKYIALCGIDAVESWSDLRRGVLVLPAGYLSNNPIVTSNASAKLPNVLPYPQTEVTTNSSNLPARDKDAIFTEKLFWQP